MRKQLTWLAVATSAFAALAQTPDAPASPKLQAGGTASPIPMTREDLLTCLNLEERTASQREAYDAHVAAHNSESQTLDAEARSIEEARRALGKADRPGEESLSRRIQAYNRRLEALRSGAEKLRAAEVQLREELTPYNASCTNRPYDERDRKRAVTERLSRKAAAAAAEPFEAGVKAFDQGKYQEALSLWLPLAEQGRVAAQFNIAVMFDQGLGVKKSDVEAARWYLMAAKGGDVSAQLKMGTLYEAGAGVAEDLSAASYWYGEASKGAGKDADPARLARERLAKLPKEFRGGSEETVAFDGGRFVLRRSMEKECIVALQGTVTRSAEIEFETMLKKAKAQTCARPLTLLLESPGGFHDAGLALARSVREERMKTIARYDCASACATIFLAGTERVLWGSRAAIGFHQIARFREGQNVEDRACVMSSDHPGVVAFRRYLRFVVPDTADEIYRIAMGTPCRSIEWVKGKRALDLQVATRIEAEHDDVFGPPQERVSAPTPGLR